MDMDIFKIIDEVVVLPIVIIIFFLLIYILAYLKTKNPDVIRSKIFLNFNIFRRAFLLLALFGSALILHVMLIYYPHILYFILLCTPSMSFEIQRILGLALAISMAAFVYFFYRSIK